MKLIKQFLLLSFALFALTACEDNLEDDNIPAIQAVRNGDFFKSTQMVAVSNADGSVTITGLNRVERLEFNLESPTAGTYPLGSGAPNEATYTLNNTDVFSTNTGLGNGQVVLSAGSPAGTLTGTFSFVSYLPMNADSLYMRRGVIFQVPFGAPIAGGTPTTGADAFVATVDGTVFNPTTISVNNTGGIISISALNGPTNFVSLIFPDTITPGAYTFDNLTYSASYAASGIPALSVSGNLVITAIDPVARTVEGTFDFTTGPPSSFNITTGAFSVSY